jgi:hypothetical protein
MEQSLKLRKKVQEFQETVQQVEASISMSKLRTYEADGYTHFA